MATWSASSRTSSRTSRPAGVRSGSGRGGVEKGKASGAEILKIRALRKSGDREKVVFYAMPGGFDLMIAKSMLDRFTIRDRSSEVEISGPKWYIERAITEGKERAKDRPQRSDGKMLTVKATKILDDREKSVRVIIDDLPVWLPKGLISMRSERGSDCVLISVPEDFMEERLQEAREYAMQRENGGGGDFEETLACEDVVRETENAVLVLFSHPDTGELVEAWFPKKQIDYQAGPDGWVLTAPGWLMASKLRDAKPARAR